MTLVDSLDSILMLYSYTDFADRSMRILSRMGQSHDEDAGIGQSLPEAPAKKTEEPTQDQDVKQHPEATQPDGDSLPVLNITEKVKQRTMSHLSIVLTIMSIALAYR
jgi:high-affinity nickel-transport protein